MNNVITNRIGTATTAVLSNTKSLLLDGTEYVNMDTVLTASVSDQSGTVSMWVKPIDATPAVAEWLWCFADANANTTLEAFINTDGTFFAFCRETATNQWQLKTDAAAFSDNTWTHTAVTHNSSGAILYINGVAVAQTFTVSVAKQTWLGDMSGLDTGRIGCRNFNSAGNTNHFNGNVDEFRIWNDDLSAAQITTHYNGGVVLSPASEPLQANLTSSFRMGDAGGDNFNVDTANEWDFKDQTSSNDIFTGGCEEADVVNDIP